LDGNQVAALTPFIGATVVSAEQSTAITGLDHIKVTGVVSVGAVTRVLFLLPFLLSGCKYLFIFNYVNND
jgi:hypothetical protein